jgi:bifunctional ADP-heptose synthase (sugar kinase/adenylyltransferase)
MKNIYLLTLKDYDYDEYDGWVVIADNEEEVLELCNICETEEEAKKACWGDNLYKGNIKEIKLIGTTEIEESKILLGSYNAG